jgi:hypothetical protein
MLDSAITFLANEANGYLKRRTGTIVDTVEAGSIADDQGKWTVTEGQLRVALINIAEERVLHSQVPERVCLNGSQLMLQPDIKLNLVVLFAARLKNYDDSLRYLSHIIALFQANPSFTPDVYPGLDPRIGKLTVEMLSYGPEQLNQMWAYVGAKYLPSVAYRVRMIVLQDSQPQGIGKPITAIETALHDK